MEELNIQQLHRFKLEKENTIQFSIKELLKDSINDWILSDIQQINMKLGQELRLISKVNNKDDIKRLKCFVKNNKSNRDNSQNDKHDHTDNIRADMSDDTYAIYDDNAP